MSNAIRVLVSGAKGRMGTEVVRAVEEADGLDLAGAIDLGDDLSAAIASTRARVVVDFTQPDSAMANARAIITAGVHPVIGTTGFTQEDIATLERMSAERRLGGLIAPNFAIGAVLLMKFAAEAAKYFPSVEVIELHHDKKLDAPSGTALKTIELIRAATDVEAPRNPDERETIDGARGGRYLGVPVHSVRLPGYVAHEEVLFGGTGQSLSIRHDSLHRESFMPGVVLAVRKVVGLDRLYYGLEQILE